MVTSSLQTMSLTPTTAQLKIPHTSGPLWRSAEQSADTRTHIPTTTLNNLVPSSTRFLRSRIVWMLSRTSPALSASADRISRTGSVPFSLRLTPATEQTLPRMLVLSCTRPRSEPDYFCYFHCIMGNFMMHTEQFLLCLHAYQITTDSVLYSFLKYQTQ